MAKVAHWRFDLPPTNGVVYDELGGAGGLVATWNGTPPAITTEAGVSGVRVNGTQWANLTGSLALTGSKGATIAFKGSVDAAGQSWGNILGLHNGSTNSATDTGVILSAPPAGNIGPHGRLFGCWKVAGADNFIGVIVPPDFIVKGYSAIKPGAKELITNGTTGTASTATTSSTPANVTFTKGKIFGAIWTPDTPVKGFFSEVILFDHYVGVDEVFTDMSIKTQPSTPIAANQEPRSQFQPQDVAWRGSPGYIYSGPIPAIPLAPEVLCKGQDLAWVRDGVQNVLQGYIESTVTISGEGVARRVLCLDQAGNLIGETMSRASDGKYRFDLLWLNRRYMLVAQDDPAFGPADYNAVAADYQLPTPYAPGEGVGLTGG